jgi:hypothetical protein
VRFRRLSWKERMKKKGIERGSGREEEVMRFGRLSWKRG